MIQNLFRGCRPGRPLLQLLGCLVVLLALAGSAGLRAQVLYGILTGTVTDPTSAAIPQVAVTVTNQATGASRNVTTNGSGEYTIRNLEPGPYTVMVKGPTSFSTFTQKNVRLEANQQVRVDAALQPASVSSEITVDTAPPVLQTETAEVNHEISQAQLSELPITSSNGRNFQQLYSLVPGVSPPAEQNSAASNPARAVAVNVNGISNTSNTTRIDGAINTYGWLPYIIAYVPPADAIQNVNIVTNSFNAEQGVAGGSSINVIIKGGTNSFHGSLWEYNQLFNTNARGYTQTRASFPRVPKNVFNDYGVALGGPIVKNKLFFFGDYERITRRQLITGFQSVPTQDLINGDFTNVLSTGTQAANTLLYDPATGDANGNGRLTFLQEYGRNAIPASRINPSAQKMLALLQPISGSLAAPNYAGQLANNYNGSGTNAYTRESMDGKINYNPTDRTTFFGHYSYSPDTITDPQTLGAAGGGTFDGGQPGLATGLIQNIGLSASHVITPNLVVDANFGFTRQRTGAQSADLSLGAFGLNTLGIPGTNGPDPLQGGQPPFFFSQGFSTLGNAGLANPFLFRDNQYTGNVNLSWTKGKHATKYGAEYYHFALNHYQPTQGGDIFSARGSFRFSGNLTFNPANTGTGNATTARGPNAYYALADFLLGLPSTVEKATQLTNPNSLRWSAFSFYAQDQWTLGKKLTLNYGARYEYYPAPTRDHYGIFRYDPTLPLNANVVVGGLGGNDNGAGTSVGWGMIEPRLGIAYRVTDHTVIRSGGGFTLDPENFRGLRDTFPLDLNQQYSGSNSYTVALDTTTGRPVNLTTGIPAVQAPSFSSGFASLTPSLTTTTIPKNFRRGYIESWNLFLQQDLGANFVAEIGYVGTHEIRQISNVNINPAPIPDNTTRCMANGQYNPSTGLTGSCNFYANALLNLANCPANNPLCYNNTGVSSVLPSFSSNYNGLQSQLTYRGSRLAQFGLIYTWSHAFNYADNGVFNGPSFAYPAYFKMNRATAGYDRTNNLQYWAIYHLPFGRDQALLKSGVASKIFGGLQVNGQLSHYSGTPFSVSAQSNNLNAPGNTLFADLVGPYRQLGGHAQSSASPVSGGQPFFDPAAFVNPAPGRFGNTHRNQFRGPGNTLINASVFRSFHVYKESAFQVRVEAFNVLNHAILPTPNNVTVGGGAFGYINNNFGAARTLQFSGRFNF